MSRSIPQENELPNPAKRIYEWHGGEGHLKVFDKETKKTTALPDSFAFTFIPLDELGCVRGFDSRENKGIYSNEVKRTRKDILTVKRDKGDTVAEGIWRDIKVKVNSGGGDFHIAVYLGYKAEDGSLQTGVLRLKGAALNAWIEFAKKHKAEIYKKAVVIHGFTEGQNGAIKFKVPKFSLKDIAETTEVDAQALDVMLQAYLHSYFTRATEPTKELTHVRDEDMPSSPPPAMRVTDDIPPDDIPF